jgi:hypothetical protein
MIVFIVIQGKGVGQYPVTCSGGILHVYMYVHVPHVHVTLAIGALWILIRQLEQAKLVSNLELITNAG